MYSRLAILSCATRVRYRCALSVCDPEAVPSCDPVMRSWSGLVMRSRHAVSLCDPEAVPSCDPDVRSCGAPV